MMVMNMMMCSAVQCSAVQCNISNLHYPVVQYSSAVILHCCPGVIMLSGGRGQGASVPSGILPVGGIVCFEVNILSAICMTRFEQTQSSFKSCAGFLCLLFFVSDTHRISFSLFGLVRFIYMLPLPIRTCRSPIG